MRSPAFNSTAPSNPSPHGPGHHSPLRQALQHLHFVGIGGAGMSALAELAQGLGFTVSGSDPQRNEATARLQSLGVQVFTGHAAAHMAGAEALVTSTAVPASNPEVQAAQAQGLPVVPRAVLLAELMRGKTGIAIAGTHGKTTTTSLMASALMAAGVDPSFVIGGKLHSVGANARLGHGPHFAAEADESDASFLLLSPIVSVVTNIDVDHMETYGHSTERLYTAFVDFIHRLPFYGLAVLCADDAGVQAVLPRLQRPVATYGLGAGCQLQAVDVQALPGARMQFTARQRGHADLPVVLQLAGLHNVCNALAVLAVARHLRLPDAATAAALEGFTGVGRRFESYGELPSADGGRYLLIDDYGHHPVEVAAVIKAARGAYPGRRLVLAFQPHRYSRTRDCLHDFAAVLPTADVLLLTEVYAAGEAPMAGADGTALAALCRASALTPDPTLESTGRPVRACEVQYIADIAALPEAIRRTVRGGDLVITLGAGSIGGVPSQLLAHHPATPGLTTKGAAA
jgi:UDP-N-acetylmuramate--alanine ligase